jgi:hypothetical protein
MGWVVNQWRLDALECLLTEAARDDLAAVRASADRDARRFRRAAERTRLAAEAELTALEDVGETLRTSVREWRVWLRDPEPPAALPDPLAPAVTERRPAAPLIVRPAVSAPAAAPTASPPRDAEPAPSAARARRPGRASLHNSALADLFRSTTGR